jgi:single-strand DNA-binding protein
MRGFNRVILAGNCTRDPQLKTLPSGTQVADFGIAINRKWLDKNSGEDREEVCFVDCSAFGNLADIIGQWVQKGKPVLIEGRLKYDQWDDQQGNKRSKLTVVVENMNLIGGRPGGEGDGDNGAGRDDDDRHQQQAPPQRQQQQQQRQSAPPQQRQQQNQRPPQNQQSRGNSRQPQSDIPF